jgi:cytochrome c biogenesis protein CcmG/thiol:disulfide interchange protein DsbE
MMQNHHTTRAGDRTAYLLILFAVAIIGLTSGCDRENRPEQIGKPAPTFALNDGQRSVDLAKMRGKVVVLNFWASWCAPCIEEMPSLDLMQKELPQIQVLAVASDEDFTEYQSYLATHHVDMLTVFDQAQTSNKLYGSFRYPETYIIDKNGVIRRKLVGPQDFTAPEMVAYLTKLAA